MGKVFKKGNQITSVDHLSSLLDQNKWIYWIDRPKHPSILLSMQLRTILKALKAGILYEAIRNEPDTR